MSYKALYRRLRPEVFDEIIGQQAIVKTIKNQIVSDRTSHAYLFTGTRGTGKTTMARILAKAINCEKPKGGNPCGKCKSCKDIKEEKSVNIIEIDAASNNGVDNIRQINEEVRYSPTIGKYKVYIIDEVHMLSTGAFNALLKTLEEPPEYVKFILATTEPSKIPATIISRCQRYDFRRLTIDEIYHAIKGYMEKENQKVSDDALYHIARISTGAMRDALSILEQSLSFFSGEEVTVEKILTLTGDSSTGDLLDIAKLIIAKDSLGVLTSLDETLKKGIDVSVLINGLIETFRNVLVLTVSTNNTDILNIKGDDLIKMKSIAEKTSYKTLSFIINELCFLQRDIKYLTNKKILLEVALIKICNNKASDNTAEIEAKIGEIEDKIKKGVPFVQANSNTVSKKKPEKKEKKKAVTPKSVPKDILKAVSEFDKIIASLDGAAGSFLQRTKPINLGTSTLYIYCEDFAVKNYFLQPEKLDIIKGELLDRYGKNYDVKIIDHLEYNTLTDNNMSREQANDETNYIYEQLKKMIEHEIKKVGEENG